MAVIQKTKLKFYLRKLLKSKDGEKIQKAISDAGWHLPDEIQKKFNITEIVKHQICCAGRRKAKAVFSVTLFRYNDKTECLWYECDRKINGVPNFDIKIYFREIS